MFVVVCFDWVLSLDLLDVGLLFVFCAAEVAEYVLVIGSRGDVEDFKVRVPAN